MGRCRRKERGREVERGRWKFCAHGVISVLGGTDFAWSHVSGKPASRALNSHHLLHLKFRFTMAQPTPNGIVQAMQSLRLHVPSSCRCAIPPLRRQTRAYATQAAELEHNSTDSTESPPTEVHAAQEINFNRFIMRPARIVPASPSYFTGSPRFIDNKLKLEALLAKYASLPTVSTSEAPRMAWFKIAQFRELVGEPVPSKKYKGMLRILQQLNCIQPEMAPSEVRETLNKFLRPGNPYAAQVVHREVDENGRARAKGKRKESTAVVQLVEGEGEVIVNGKSLVETFKRVHDRESALWALRCADRIDKYNAWITVRGGGVTGQAEAITLAIGRALMMHEPGLKPVLRKGKSFLMILSRLLLTMAQLVLLPPMLVVWRGRSPVMSRHARCLHGSSVRPLLSSSFLYLPCIIYQPWRFECQFCSISCTQCIWAYSMTAHLRETMDCLQEYKHAQTYQRAV